MPCCTVSCHRVHPGSIPPPDCPSLAHGREDPPDPLAHRHVHNPSLAGCLTLSGPKWSPVAGHVRSMHQTVAPAESIVALTTRMARGEEAAFRDFHETYFHRLFH